MKDEPVKAPIRLGSFNSSKGPFTNYVYKRRG